jgi:hypothetical protein
VLLTLSMEPKRMWLQKSRLLAITELGLYF